jgi:hypothetical protein
LIRFVLQFLLTAVLAICSPFQNSVPNTGTTHPGDTSPAAFLLGCSGSVLSGSTSPTYKSKPDCSVRIHGSRKQRRDYLKPVGFAGFQARFSVFWFMYLRTYICMYVCIFMNLYCTACSITRKQYYMLVYVLLYKTTIYMFGYLFTLISAYFAPILITFLRSNLARCLRTCYKLSTFIAFKNIWKHFVFLLTKPELDSGQFPPTYVLYVCIFLFFLNLYMVYRLLHYLQS